MARRDDRRRFGPGPYLLGLRWRGGGHGFPFDVPAMRAVAALQLDRPVTLLAGDNGTGKSTLIEAMAESMGFAAQGGELHRLNELPAVPRPVLNDALEPVLSHSRPSNGTISRLRSAASLRRRAFRSHGRSG